jgi:hypothetical protein
VQACLRQLRRKLGIRFAQACAKEGGSKLPHYKAPFGLILQMIAPVRMEVIGAMIPNRFIF